ncbi:MAG: Clp protease N-terminal domain-containing protein [Hyphomicrobium sp.]
MGYRGEDLDLRTPQTWSASASELASAGEGPGSARGGYRTGPIWVDDTVLACSNHAFDVALAHRAGEVRLEHLLHALTRIEAAAEALEARGVRVAALRRESATIIASEIPVGLPNGKGAPRRSEEFAEVLRLAAVNAARRNAPAGIEDLLYVLFDQRADLPGLALLARHTTVRQVREQSEPLPPLGRYVTEARYVAAPSERGTKGMTEAPRYAPEASRAFRADLTGTPTDSIQNSRLDALEQMVRALSTDLSNERHVVSGLLKDLSKETQAQRGDQGRLQNTLADRLNALEQAVTQVRSGPHDDGLHDRLTGMESGLEQRLADMARSWAVLSDRLQSLDMAVREKPAGSSFPADMFDRLRASFDLKPIANRLDIIEEALLSADPRKDDGMTDRIVDRLKAFETEISRAFGERLKMLEAEISRAGNLSTSGVSRMETLISGFERQRGEMMSSLMQPVVERVSSVISSTETQQAATVATLAKVIDRLNAVEQAMAAEIETAAAKHQAYAQDLTEVHDALMKLNQNQHTLAGSIDQWRSDAAGDLSVISNRLTNLDRDNERPIETLNALSTHMDNMNKMMIERYHRRNRFWYWLFGTDDWIGASWPSQAAALESERQKFKSPKPV